MTNGTQSHAANALKGHPSKDITSLADFFAKFPPGREARIAEVKDSGVNNARGKRRWDLALPLVSLHCSSPDCDGDRVFASTDEPSLHGPSGANEFIRYECRNCGQTFKVFAIYWRSTKELGVWEIIKYGERPAFGPSTPTRLVTLLGDERDYFLKGRRCESQALGIAAFAYYRRVVENRKTTLIGEIAKVATKLGGRGDLLAELEAAKQETRFESAVAAIKHGLPEQLLVGGHNPLTLLHNALSQGLHNGSDDECLELATSIRTVLAELVERLGVALKDDQALSEAVTKLMARNPSATPAKG